MEINLFQFQKKKTEFLVVRFTFEAKPRCKNRVFLNLIRTNDILIFKFKVFIETEFFYSFVLEILRNFCFQSNTVYLSTKTKFTIDT
jgi:hypothetical protein